MNKSSTRLLTLKIIKKSLISITRGMIGVGFIVEIVSCHIQPGKIAPNASVLSAVSANTVFSEDSVSPAKSQFDSSQGDACKSFIGANGDEIEVVVLKPRITHFYNAVQVTGESDDNFFDRVIEYGKANPKTRITLPTKTYTMTKLKFVSGLTDIEIDGSYSTFSFQGNGWGNIWIQQVNRFFMKNLTIQYDIGAPLFSTGTVVSSGSGKGRLELGSSRGGAVTEKIMLFSGNTFHLSSKLLEYKFAKGTTLDGSGRSASSTALSSFVGKRVVVDHYNYDTTFAAIQIKKSEDVSLSNVTLQSIPGFNIVATRTRGVLVDSVKIQRKDGDPMSSGRDGFHTKNSQDIIVTNNEFSYMGDDSLNINGLFLLMGSVHENTMTASDDHLWRIDLYEVGDTVLVFGEGHITLGEKEITAINTATGVITLSSSVPSGTSYIYSLTSHAQRIYIGSNYFHNHRARGMLIQGNNALIENNRISNVTHQGMNITSSPSYWKEGIGAQNVIARNNTFKNLGATIDTELIGIINVCMEGTYTSSNYIPFNDIEISGNRFTNTYNPSNLNVYVNYDQTGRIKLENNESDAVNSTAGFPARLFKVNDGTDHSNVSAW